MNAGPRRRASPDLGLYKIADRRPFVLVDLEVAVAEHGCQRAEQAEAVIWGRPRGREHKATDGGNRGATQAQK